MDDNTWLLGNINQTGYFRVNYDLQNWKLLIQQLHNNPQVSLLLCPSVCLFLLSSLSFILSFFLRSSPLETEPDSSTTPSTWPGESALQSVSAWFTIPLLKQFITE